MDNEKLIDPNNFAELVQCLNATIDQSDHQASTQLFLLAHSLKEKGRLRQSDIAAIDRLLGKDASKIAQHAYERAGLIPFLERIREPARYGGNKLNVLTNAAFGNDFDITEIVRELHLAIDAGNRKDHEFAPTFSHPMQGLAYGLNPYTDWALAQLRAPPTHYYLFLGLDWYSISDTESPFAAVTNLFRGSDRYWHNIWAWILQKRKQTSTGRWHWQTPIDRDEAADFIREDGGAFIFHNRIPYLRPASIPSTNNTWYETEWKKESVRKDVVDDLSTLRSLAGDEIYAFCTSKESKDTLDAAGYKRVMSWGAHPSRGLPHSTCKEGLRFPKDYFAA